MIIDEPLVDKEGWTGVATEDAEETLVILSVASETVPADELGKVVEVTSDETSDLALLEVALDDCTVSEETSEFETDVVSDERLEDVDHSELTPDSSAVIDDSNEIVVEVSDEGAETLDGSGELEGVITPEETLTSDDEDKPAELEAELEAEMEDIPEEADAVLEDGVDVEPEELSLVKLAGTELIAKELDRIVELLA